jgi:hypothetical protein
VLGGTVSESSALISLVRDAHGVLDLASNVLRVR